MSTTVYILLFETAVLVVGMELPSVTEQNRIIENCPLILSKNLPYDYKTFFNTTLNISTDLTLYQMTEINDLTKSMTFYAMFSFYWTLDCPIIFTDMLYFTVDSSSLWIPRVIHSNAAGYSHRPFNDYSKDIMVLNIPGAPMVLWYAVGKYESLCEHFTFQKFPFDTLICSMVIESEDIVDFADYFINGFVIDNMDTFIGDTEIWKLIDMNHSTGTKQQETESKLDFRRLTFTLTFERKYEYYIGLIFLPTTLLHILQLAALIMPPEQPDRPAFSMSVVLTIFVVLSMIYEKIPETSENIYLVYFIEVKLLMSVVLTIYMLVICKLAAGQAKLKTKSKLQLQQQPFGKRNFTILDLIVGTVCFLLVFVADVVLIIYMTT